ncbi:substrate-binding domain-containing protein [Gallaecimonas mangrovi]|uniref:substrate-binding domain-containing protein n=1 Tax=Gallaecimonas mangrovi TaxID=2291597 RepID=UPI000E20425C|nr:substrate-binding domain-containing protein [Gallaecimonas mangrovi]
MFKKSLLGLVALSFSLITASAHSDTLTVVTSGGFSAAYQQLNKGYAKATGETFKTEFGPSMGKSKQAIPARLARGEHIDVVIMVGYALDKLIKAGKVKADSRVELADSRIGMVVKAGQPKPDISSVAKLKQALLDAKSVAYSDSASGVYIQNQLFGKLGIKQQMLPKSHMIQRIPVASVIAKGQYQLGFQQVAELLPIKGVSFVRRIPESVQSVTRYAAGVVVNAEHPAAAKAFLQYLTSAKVQKTIQATGLDSVPR